MELLGELLDYWFVMPPGAWENELSDSPIGNWYAVGNEEDGIVAYFMDEEEAHRYRYDAIRREIEEREKGIQTFTFVRYSALYEREFEFSVKAYTEEEAVRKADEKWREIDGL